MNKLIKFFSLIFLLFVISYNCLAFSDYRYIGNQTVVDGVKAKIKPPRPGPTNIDFRGITFAVNYQGTSASIIVPILNFDNSKIIEEAVISVGITDAGSADDIFDVLIKGTNDSRWFFDSDVKWLKPKNIYKYMYTTTLSSFLNPFITLSDDDRIFYMLPPDGSFANLRVVVEGDGKASQSFVFQKNGELKPVNSTPSVVHAGFFENLLDAVRGYFLKQEGYARVLTDDSRDAKLKSE